MKLLPLLLTGLVALEPLQMHGADTATDPFLGKWILDVRASHYPLNTCPKAMTIEMTREAGGVHYHSHTEPQVGEPFDVDYTADYDGTPAMVTGSKGILLPVSLQRNAQTVVATYRNAFQTAATSERVLAKDAKSMTVTTTSRDPNGKTVINVGVYRKLLSASSLPASGGARSSP